MGNAGRCAITHGGTEAGAHAEVVRLLRMWFGGGDWTYEATLMMVDEAPCAWRKLGPVSLYVSVLNSAQSLGFDLGGENPVAHMSH